ncbi:unnamed protein product, partial [Porites lobata]
MRELDSKAPAVAEAFKQGLFTVTKTRRRFSCIAIDQAHEQNNAMVKDDGGAVGLTENASALRRWMLSGPEMARLVNEFEACMAPEVRPETNNHHEAERGYQAAYHKDVRSLVDVLDDLGNPFEKEGKDLIVLDTKVVADEGGVSRMQQIEDLGSRNGNLDEFFKHENQACPPSISDQGNLRLPRQKSELASCLQALTTPKNAAPANCEVIIMDGAALVNMLKPTGKEKTFSEYASNKFIPYVTAQLQHVKRIDIVWDEYVENSLKATTRSKRGSGVRQLVAANNKLPRNWKEFLREDRNKQELFRFLAQCATSVNSGQRQIISTYARGVLTSLPRDDTSSLAPSSHEEADTRMFIHAADAIQSGFTKIIVRSVDTDVLVLAVALVQKLQALASESIQLWVAFGTGEHLRYLAAHEIANKFNNTAALALPAFHAFTGCDTVSCFYGKSKKTALEAWKSFPEVTPVFIALSRAQTEIAEEWMSTLERFVVLLYDRTSSSSSVNEARKQLFTRKARNFDALPPTRDSLLEHVKRTAYQAGHIWGQALVPNPPIPSPQDWGWILESGEWRPFWTTLSEITKSCQELVKCGCKKGCRGGCGCQK